MYGVTKYEIKNKKYISINAYMITNHSIWLVTSQQKFDLFSYRNVIKFKSRIKLVNYS